MPQLNNIDIAIVERVNSLRKLFTTEWFSIKISEKYNSTYFNRLKEANNKAKDLFFKFVELENASFVEEMKLILPTLQHFFVGIKQLQYITENVTNIEKTSNSSTNKKENNSSTTKFMEDLNKKLKTLENSLEIARRVINPDLTVLDFVPHTDQEQRIGFLPIRKRTENIVSSTTKPNNSNDSISKDSTTSATSINEKKPTIENQTTMFIAFPYDEKNIQRNQPFTNLKFYVKNENQTPKHFVIDSSKTSLSTMTFDSGKKFYVALLQLDDFSIINNALVIILFNDLTIYKIQRLDILPNNIVVKYSLQHDVKNKITKIHFDEEQFNAVKLYYMILDSQQGK